MIYLKWFVCNTSLESFDNTIPHHLVKKKKKKMEESYSKDKKKTKAV